VLIRKADKFRVNDADCVAWEMCSFIGNAEPEQAPARDQSPCGCGT